MSQDSCNEGDLFRVALFVRHRLDDVVHVSWLARTRFRIGFNRWLIFRRCRRCPHFYRVKTRIVLVLGHAFFGGLFLRADFLRPDCFLLPPAFAGYAFLTDEDFTREPAGFAPEFGGAGGGSA